MLMVYAENEEAVERLRLFMRSDPARFDYEHPPDIVEDDDEESDSEAN